MTSKIPVLVGKFGLKSVTGRYSAARSTVHVAYWYYLDTAEYVPFCVPVLFVPLEWFSFPFCDLGPGSRATRYRDSTIKGTWEVRSSSWCHGTK